MSGSNLAFLLRPKWIAFHVVVAASVALMVWLAFWQLDRLEERRDFNDLVSEQIDIAPVPLDALLAEAGEDPSTIEWRQALVSGTYLPDQILWFNRSQDGLAGDNVLTPMIADAGAGRTVLVNRGFVTLGSDIPAAPAGDQEILVRIRLPQERQRGELTDSSSGGGRVTEVRRINLDELSTQLPGDVAPVYVDLIDAIPALSPSDPAPVPPPTLDEGPHLSYAAQWMIFALCVLIGWGLAIRRSIRIRRRGLRAEAPEPAMPDSGPPDAVESASSTTGTDAPSLH